MIKYKVYEVTVNSDMTEGRGPMRHLAFFTDQNDAELAGEPHKIMGVGKGHSVKFKELRIYQSLNEYTERTAYSLRKSALAKLTDDEKRALGINKV